MNLEKEHIRSFDDIKSPMKGALCTMCADMCLFTPWISIIEDAPNYRIPERMQIGTSLFPFSAPPYLLHVLPKRHPFILSSMSHQLSYQEDVRLKDKKGRLNEIVGKRGVERQRERGRQEEGWKCVDGWKRWEAKLTAEKLENVD